MIHYKNKIKVIGIVGLILVLVSNVLYAQPLPLPKDLTVGKLDNGLTYYLLPEGERGKLRLTMLSKVGSWVENQDQDGYAHMLEHMMFNGSDNFPGKTCFDAMDDMGMRLGHEFSAFTSTTDTEYNLIIPPNNKAYFKQSLLLFKDWMFYLDMDSVALENEKKVIGEEINRGGSKVSILMNNTYLEGHDVLGDKDAINSITTERLMGFYKKHYRPDNLALIVCGEMDEKYAIKTIKKLFGDIPENKIENQSVYPELWHENNFTPENMFSGDDKEIKLNIAGKSSLSPVLTQSDLADKLKRNVLNRMMELRFKSAPNQSVKNAVVGYSHSFTRNQILNFSLGNYDKVSYKSMLDDFCYVIKQALDYGFSDAEIDFAAQQQIEWYSKRREQQSADFQTVSNYFLKGNIPLTGYDNYELNSALSKSLKSADFEDLLQVFLHQNKTVVYDSASVAYSADFNAQYILNCLNSIDSIRTEPFEFKVPSGFSTQKLSNPFELNVKAGESLKPAKKEEVAESLQVLHFANGRTVILNNTPGKFAVIKTLGRGGLNLIPEKDRALFEKSIRQLESGYANISSSDVAKYERSAGVFKNVRIDNYAFEYEFKSQDNNMELLCQIYKASLTEAHEPNREKFEKNLKRIKLPEPNAYRDFKNKALLMSLSKGVDSLNMELAFERFVQYRHDILTNNSSSVIYIKGELPYNMEELVSEYIANIPSSNPQVFNPSINLSAIVSGIVRNDFEWGRDVSIVEYLFNRYPDKPLTLKDELIIEAIKQYTNNMVFNIIRGKYGLIYANGTTGFTVKYPHDLSALSVRFMIDTTNIDRANTIMRAEVLGPMAKGDITDKEVNRLKAMLKSVYVLNFYDEAKLGDAWLKMIVKYNDIISPKQLEKVIDSITTSDIQNTMRNIVDLNNYNLFIRRPRY